MYTQVLRVVVFHVKKKKGDHGFGVIQYISHSLQMVSDVKDNENTDANAARSEERRVGKECQP